MSELGHSRRFDLAQLTSGPPSLADFLSDRQYVSNVPRAEGAFQLIASLHGFKTAILMKRGVGVREPSSSPRWVDKSAGVDRLGQEALRRHRQHRRFDRGRRPVLSFQHLPELFDFGRHWNAPPSHGARHLRTSALVSNVMAVMLTFD
jgi:hypothetical protein